MTVHDWGAVLLDTKRKETRGQQAEYVLCFDKAVSQLLRRSVLGQEMWLQQNPTIPLPLPQSVWDIALARS